MTFHQHLFQLHYLAVTISIFIPRTGLRRPGCASGNGRNCGGRPNRRRGGRRNKKVHMNVEVDGSIDTVESLMEEVDEIVEEVAEQV